MAIGVSHCGAGCTLGDIIGAWIVFASGWKLLGLALPSEYIAGLPKPGRVPRRPR